MTGILMGKVALAIVGTMMLLTIANLIVAYHLADKSKKKEATL